MHRLQVAVDGDLAERIADLAQRVERSQRWMATELLNMAVEDRQSLSEYLVAQILKLGHDLARATARAKAPEKTTRKASVYFDLQVKPETFAYIEGLGQQLGHSPARMAAVMLDWGVRESDFAIRWLALPLVRAQRALEALRTEAHEHEARATG